MKKRTGLEKSENQAQPKVVGWSRKALEQSERTRISSQKFITHHLKTRAAAHSVLKRSGILRSMVNKKKGQRAIPFLESKSKMFSTLIRRLRSPLLR
jgi:hypothetical protein